MPNGSIPTRHQVSPDTARRYGERAALFGEYLNHGDPLADAAAAALEKLPLPKARQLVATAVEKGIKEVPEAPQELREFFRHVDRVPFWVDWEEIAHGGNAFLRSGVAGALVLACRSLPLCYASPSGNKPLVLSGQLVTQATPRLAETGHFIVETCRPDGLRRNSEGFKRSVLVRLKHATVRRLLLASGRWNSESWGHPINQADLAATNLMFSVSTLDGLRELGFRFSERERSAFMQLWRYSGHLMGIEPELLCATADEARRMARLVLDTQGAPDKDSRQLIQALMDEGIPTAFVQRFFVGRLIPRAASRLLLYGFSSALVGNRLASELGYPTSFWARSSIPASKSIVSLFELGRKCLPGGNRVALRLGTRMLEQLVARSLAEAGPALGAPAA